MDIDINQFECTCISGISVVSEVEQEMADRADIPVSFVHNFIDYWADVARDVAKKRRDQG